MSETQDQVAHSINDQPMIEDQDHQIFVVHLERSAHDNDILQYAYDKKLITANPAENKPLAEAQQLARELQAAYDETGIEGRFQIKAVFPNRRLADTQTTTGTNPDH